MDKVEGAVAKIQGLSATRDDWASLSQQLETTATPEWEPAALDAVLSQLEPARHAVGCSYFLSARAKLLSGGDGQDEAFMRHARRLLIEGDAEQLKFARPKVQEICDVFTLMCRRSGNAMYGIRALREGVRKVAPSADHLTPLHHQLLLLSLLSKCFNPALEVLEGRVVRVSKEGMQARDVLLYIYYGGMVFAAVKRFDRAFDTLQLAFTMPCHALHEIVVEIYKKYVLISLITHGEVVALPKYTTPLLQRMLKGCCSAYHDVATAFATHKVDDVKVSLAKHQAVFTSDGNWGLASQAAKSLYGRNIQRLTQTFVTLSLQDIAQEVSLEDGASAKRKLLEMMARGEISASVDQEKGMVSFEAARMGPGEALTRLTEQMRVCNELNERMRVVDETISSSSMYLDKVAIQERQSRWGEPADWVAHGASTDELMDVAEKPPGFSASHGAR
uniref:COP9 signalosome complex subunit 3 n=1 Tax=Hemiselmis andersenii TaxID=464988 RepID=A0A6U4WDP4_HEMAN